MIDDIFDNLPKRDNDIYIEIENFEDYEYTNCIAYEMAMRNFEIMKLRRLSNRILVLFHTKINRKLIKGEHFEDLEIKYPKLYHFLRIRENINDELKEKYFFDNDYFEIKEMHNLIDKDFVIKDDMVSELIEERNMALKGDNNYIKPIYNSKIVEGYIIEQKLKSNIKTVIRPNFKKYLPLPMKYDNQISIIINPNLPKEELIAYISKIKDDFDKDNSIIKNPLELLGKDLEKAIKIKNKALPKDKNKRKKTMADAFYIYDIWNILELHYIEKTMQLKEEQKKEIKNIKQNKYIDKYDKKSLIDEVNLKYKDLLIQYAKPYLKDEIATQLNTSKDTVEKLHTLMIKYIDNLKYKELITGVTN